MQSFKDYLYEQEIDETIKQLLVIEDMTLTEAELLCGDTLNEGFFDNVAKKAGLHIERNKGLIQYLKGAGKNMAKLIIAAVRRDKETIQLVMKSIKKEDLLDFLLKLDQATLHLITGPLHFIEAVTGIHIWAHVKSKAEEVGNALDMVKNALQRVRDGVVKIISDKRRQKTVLKRIQGIEKHLTTT